MRNKALFRTTGILLAAILLLSYNDDPPNGRSGAPFDGHCRDCHSSNNPYNFNGLAAIIGLPDTVQPLTTYSLQLKVTPTAGLPLKAGFQLVIVDKINQNAGNLTAVNSEADTEFLAGREYLDHRGGKNFTGGSVTWNFEWTSPANAACNTLNLYYIVNFCNGDGGDFGDFPLAFTNSRHLAGGPPFLATASTVSNVSCLGGNDGIVTVQTNGAQPPYQYLWSTGATSQTVNTLQAGLYAVTVTDSLTCTSLGQTQVLTLDTIRPQIECPPSRSVCADDTVYYPPPTVLDNCDLEGEEAELLAGLPSGLVFPPGITQQTFQVSDVMGNLASCAFTVQVWPVPTIAVDTIVHDINGAGTGSIAISIEKGNSGPFSYVWRKDGVVFSTTLEDLTGLYSGQYALEVVDSNGCSGFLNYIAIGNTVGTTVANSATIRYRIFPNPVVDAFWIDCAGDVPIRTELLGLNGKRMRVWGKVPSSGVIPLSGIPAGCYVLKIETMAGNLVVMRLMKAE